MRTTTYVPHIAHTSCRCKQLGLITVLMSTALSIQPAMALNGSSPGTNFPMVGQIVGGVDGVLIAPNWVLTAGHAATSAKLFSSGQGQAMIDASFVLPGYQFPGNDLALLHLATPINASAYTALNLDYLEDSHLGQIGSVTLANASGNAQSSSWQNRYVESTLIDSIPRAGNYALHWVVADQHSSGMPLLQSGDSGSGLFLSAADSANPLLGGIASAICMTNRSCFVQPTAYRDWLDITLMLYVPSNPEELRRQQLNWVSLDNAALATAASGSPLNPSNAYISAVPEPGKSSLLLLGLAWLAGRGFLGWRRRMAVVQTDHRLG